MGTNYLTIKNLLQKAIDNDQPWADVVDGTEIEHDGVMLTCTCDPSFVGYEYGQYIVSLQNKDGTIVGDVWAYDDDDMTVIARKEDAQRSSRTLVSLSMAPPPRLTRIGDRTSAANNGSAEREMHGEKHV
jgi:hypothetical protein